jgi:hypothetical protein
MEAWALPVAARMAASVWMKWPKMSLSDLGFGLFEVVTLVADVEFLHKSGFERGLQGCVVECCASVDHDGEEFWAGASAGVGEEGAEFV